MIYGVAILAGCAFLGSLIGNVLGLLTGINSDIGGVGFSMLLLLLVTNSKMVNKILPENYSKGIDFWKEMFIPVIIAMSASQNVISALKNGWAAIVAGIGVVIICLLLVPFFNMFNKKSDKKSEEEDKA